MNEEKIDFSYPEGYQKALESLDFLAEEEREMMVQMLFGYILSF